METIKTTENLEFDVIYADGTRHHVKEGILFGVEDEKIIFHNGTDRPEVIFAVAETIVEILDHTKPEPCPECKGRGYIDYSHPGTPQNPDYCGIITETCPICGGLGLKKED